MHSRNTKNLTYELWVCEGSAELNKLAENPTTVDDCKDLLQLVSSIRNQSPIHSMYLDPDEWAALDKKLSECSEKAENMLLELGHFEAALDEISDWTSRTGKQLSAIGHGDNDQTDLAKLELLQADLGSKKAAIQKLKPKLKDFPSQQKRFNTVVDNLDKESGFNNFISEYP